MRSDRCSRLADRFGVHDYQATAPNAVSFAKEYMVNIGKYCYGCLLDFMIVSKESSFGIGFAHLDLLSTSMLFLVGGGVQGSALPD